MKSPEIDLDFTPDADLMHDEAEANRFGGVTLVVKGEQVLLDQAAGHALRWAKLPINRDTRFALASTSKLFTVTAIGQLIELGLVSLEDPVTKFLPEHAHRTGWSEVTLRHLLSHTSGFGSFWGPEFDARRPTWCASPRPCSMEQFSNPRRLRNLGCHSTAWPRHQACQPCSLAWASW